MSGAITNEGVPDYEGTLFNGLKFYLQPMIPSKTHRADLLKQNGAKVVLLDKHADIRIGDPGFPKRAPPNAVSFKYIDDCIQEGKLLNIEDKKYQIHVPPSGRPGVPSTGPKGTRTPFTDADDKILVRWVLEHEQKGESLKGNKIYDMLAESYPNHTSQSWRDRWVKKFSDLSRKDWAKYLEGQELPPPPAPRQANPISSKTAVSRPTPAVSRLQPEQNPSRKRVPFTTEDDEILLDYVRKRVHAGMAHHGNTIYQELEEQYPHHSFHSWLARYKHLQRGGKATPAPESTNLAADDRKSPPSVSGSISPEDRRSSHRLSVASGSAPGRQATSVRQSIDSTANNHTSRPSASSPRTPQDRRSSHRLSVASGSARMGSGASARQSIDLTAEDRGRRSSASSRTISNIITKDKLTPEQRLKLVKAVRTIQRLWRGYRVRRDLPPREPPLRHVTADTPEPIEMSGAAESLTAGRPDPTEQPPPSSFGAKDASNSQIQLPYQKERDGDEEQFYSRLKAFQNYKGTVPGYTTVGITLGREMMAMPLWNLWSAATKQQSDHSQRDWKEIATILGISWEDFPDVTEQLKAAFEKSLLGLEELLAKYTPASESDEDASYESGEEESDIGAEDRDVVAASAHGNGEDSPAAAASSPPPITGSKRTRDQIGESSEIESAGGVRKRRRYNDDDEIACSPELTRTAATVPFDAFTSPQLLPLLPKSSTPRASTILESIEDDLVEPTPTRQQRVGPRTPIVRESVRSESSDDAFDPPDDSRPAQKITRRALPWAKPAQPNPSSAKHTNPALLPLQPTLQRNSPPSRQPPPMPSVQGTQAPQEPNIDHFISLGYDEEDVEEALAATTNDVGLAGQVMESIKDGRGIPTNVAGVWTARDDRTLDLCHRQASGKLGSDVDKQREAMQGRERVIKKHGDRRCRARAKYLGKVPWT